MWIIIMAVQPSNLNKGLFRLSNKEVNFVIKPFSFSKNKNATTPINGGVARGINSNADKKDLNGIL